jgi:hypothetical protein
MLPASIARRATDPLWRVVARARVGTYRPAKHCAYPSTSDARCCRYFANFKVVREAYARLSLIVRSHFNNGRRWRGQPSPLSADIVASPTKIISTDGIRNARKHSSFRLERRLVLASLSHLHFEQGSRLIAAPKTRGQNRQTACPVRLMRAITARNQR